MLSHISDRDGGLVVGGWAVFLRDLGLSMESAEPGEGVTLGFICCGKRCLPDTLGGALRKGHENWVVVFPRSLVAIPLKSKAHNRRVNVDMSVISLV